MDEQIRRVLDSLYAEDAQQRERGLSVEQRTRNVAHERGRLLSLLAIVARAKSVLEIGSSNGVSTIWFAAAMRETGGFVIGTELIPERAAQGNENLAAAGLSAFGEIRAGDARRTVETLTGPFDLVFIDAEKDDYLGHFLAVVDKVRAHGLIVADNVLSHDISAYQNEVRKRGDAVTVTIPLERGLELTTKLR